MNHGCTDAPTRSPPTRTGADTYCPDCLIATMIAAGDASRAARDMPTEDVLDQCAAAAAIGRTDETNFDSSESPKVVFLDQVREGDTCGRCHAPF
jgi:hypothetical protein